MIDINEMVGKATPEQLRLAIQDVLAVHEIDEGNYTLRYAGNDNQVHYETCKCMDDYPCETRQKITNRLGGTE